MAIIPKYIKLRKTYRLNVHCDNISRHWKKYDCLWYLSLPIHFQRCRIENGFSWLCCKKFAVFGCLTVKLGRPGRGGLGGQPERERERELLKYSSLVAPCSLFWPSLLDYKDNTTSIQSSFNSWHVQSQSSHYSWIRPLILKAFWIE